MKPLVLALFLSLFASASIAQFSKPVVILKGTVKCSAHARVKCALARDTAQAVSSTVNSATGRYLLVLKPDEDYSLSVSDNSETLEECIRTPKAENGTVQVQRD